MIAGQKGFWDFEERLAELSAKGDPLVKLSATVDFEVFRPILLHHIGIEQRFGFIRASKVTDVAAHDGARLRKGLIDRENTASGVWADTAYRSAKNEK